MSETPNCPGCRSEYTYESGPLFVRPDCGREWSAEGAAAEAEERILRDAHGNELQSGNTVRLIKDLQLKGTSTTLKIETKVRNIRIYRGADHDIDCRANGIDPLKLKSQFSKKSSQRFRP